MVHITNEERRELTIGRSPLGSPTAEETRLVLESGEQEDLP